jgi:RNA polymerase sigma-70 factor (ECF subfamily)
MFRETEEFSIFSIMSDDVPTIESQLISTQVEQDLKLIDELPLDQKKFW